MTNRATVRRLLWRWGRVAEFCTAKTREIEFFAEKLEASRGLTGYVADGQPHGSEVSDPTARAALRMESILQSYADLVDGIAQDIEQETAFKRSMDELINALPHEQRRVLELRYVDGHQWVFIGMKMCMDETTAKRMEARAVDEIMQHIETCHEMPRRIC